MSNQEEYAAYFLKGLKLTVCIPMGNNEVFRDWAVVESLEEDVITVRLSRDELPVKVHLIAGTLLDIRLGKVEPGFRCGGFFLEWIGAGLIQVHLTGSVLSCEQREFFRIDLFLPFRYELAKEQNLDVLIEMWRKKKQTRVADEAERREAFDERHRERLLRTVTGEFDPVEREGIISRQENAEEFNPVDETWDNVNATSMNLSAGGLMFVTSDVIEIDQLFFVEMFIPSTPPRIMDSIVRAVFKSNNYSIKDKKEYFNIALSFVLIDDRDRDAIVSHISHLESLRIRLKHQLPVSDITHNEDKNLSPLKIFISVLILMVLIYLFSSYFFEYTMGKVHNDIQDLFGDAIRKYSGQTGK